MATKMIHYKLFWDFEKEERWLEQMSAQGWHLIKIAGISYTFEQGTPEERIYKIDFRWLKRKQDVEDYLALFADSGWKCAAPRVAGTNFYFNSHKGGGVRDIFSDGASKAQRSLRYATYMGYSLVGSLLPYTVLYASGAFHVKDLGYQTPGLWNMPWREFIFHFLFETPFVVLRVSAGLFPLILLMVGLLFISRYYRQYRESLVE
jgi:hypothetical protein